MHSRENLNKYERTNAKTSDNASYTLGINRVDAGLYMGGPARGKTAAEIPIYWPQVTKRRLSQEVPPRVLRDLRELVCMQTNPPPPDLA